MDSAGNFARTTLADSLSFWENFVESIAQVLSKSLTDKETEKLVSSWNNFQKRLKELSHENLKRLQAEASYKRPYCKHPGSCSDNVLRGFLRSFLGVFTLKYGLGFFPALFSGAILKNPSTLLKLAGKDTMSFSTFLSCFIASYKAVLCLLRRYRRTNDPWNAFFAGTVSGLALLLDSNKSRRIMIALYLSTRTLHFISRYIWRHHLKFKYDPYAERPALEENKKDNNSSEQPGNTLSDSNDINKSKKTPQSVTRDYGKLRTFTIGSTDSVNIPSNSNLSSIPFTPEGSLSHLTIDHSISQDELTSIKTNSSPVSTSKNYFLLKTPSPLSSPVDPGILEAHRQKANSVRQFFKRSAAVLVMMVSSSQILNAYVAEPDTLAKPYLSFLILHGGIKSRQPKRPRQYLNVLGECLNSFDQCQSTKYIVPPLGPESPIPFVDNVPDGLPKDKLFPFSEWMTQHPHDFVFCSLQHNHTKSCCFGVVKQFSEGMQRAISMYGPLSTIMMIIFRYKDILKNPIRSVLYIIKSTLRSSLFLASYVTMAWCSPCAFRNWMGRDKKWMYYVNGLLSGLLVLIEAPGRQLELALYCFPRAIESFWNCLVKWGYTKNMKGGEALYFSLATGFVMTLYQHDPVCIQDGLSFFFILKGNPYFSVVVLLSSLFCGVIVFENIYTRLK